MPVIFAAQTPCIHEFVEQGRADPPFMTGLQQLIEKAVSHDLNGQHPQAQPVNIQIPPGLQLLEQQVLDAPGSFAHQPVHLHIQCG